MLFDSNDITLDGKLDLSSSESIAKRFEAYGWQVLRVEDGNDLPAIEKAIQEGQADTLRPTLIEVKTVIGYGSPNKQGKGGHGGTHGSPLGADEAKLTKEYYKWVYEENFHVPAEVRDHFAQVKDRGISANKAWDEKFAEYKKHTLSWQLNSKQRLTATFQKVGTVIFLNMQQQTKRFPRV